MHTPSRMTFRLPTFPSLACAACLMFAGCTPAPTMTAPKAEPAKESAGEHAEHAHPSSGPHKGPLIELGNEEYHAEILNDDAHRVTIYVLDSGAAKAVPIEAKEITLNLKAGGKPKQYKLAAKPQAEDGEGKSSCFELESEDLSHQLDEEDAGASVNLEIAGKAYSGKVPHGHGHTHDHK